MADPEVGAGATRIPGGRNATFALPLLGALCLCGLAPFGSEVSAQATPRWRLEPVRTIREPDGSAGMLGRVVGLALTPDGGLFVAEVRPARVSYYGANGRFERIIAADGEGPGEVRDPRITAKGDTVIIFDGGLNRITRLTKDGTALESWRVPGVPSGSMKRGPTVTEDGSIIMVTQYPTDSATNTALRLRPNGRFDTLAWSRDPRHDRISSVSGEGWTVKGVIPFSPLGVDLIDRKGRVVIGGTTRSAWFVLAGKDTVERIAFADRPIPIPAAVRESVFVAVKARLQRVPRAANALTRAMIPATIPPWLSLDIDDTGRWWIGRPDRQGSLASWDIVEGSRIVASIPAPSPISTQMSFARGTVALLHEDDDGLPWIGVYRVRIGGAP